MSQIYKNSGSGPTPPEVATSYVTDINSPAVPAANILNVIGGYTSTNNLNLIQTDGSSGGDTLTIQLTNTLQGFISTMDATPTNIITFNLGATPGIYSFAGNVEGFNTTDIAGGTYFLKIAVRTTGAAGVIIGTDFSDFFEEAAMATADAIATVVGNNLLVQVTGIAATAIDWRALINYRFVG